jgi:flagellar P-ring protein precursor FlgI
MTRGFAHLLVGALALALASSAAASERVRVKDLGRFLGWRDNALVGYGVVTGLSGSGDSPHSVATQQALSSVLSRLGANVPPEQLQSRNVATVIVTATLPPTARVGDRIDVNVASVGDARSLVGGTLLMTPLLGPDQKSYALAQGSLVVGGYDFRANGNLRQKNYPTSGTVAGGATVETPVDANILGADGRLTFVLKDPDFTTAERVAEGLNRTLGEGIARAQGADSIVINAAGSSNDVNRLIAEIENVSVSPDEIARVVINERSGTVVAGAGVQISSVVVAQGDIKVSVSVDREVRFPNTTVADLVRALAKARVDTRSTIAILQAIKAAGALHADIIVQ